MLTTEPTPEMIAEWKRVFEAGRAERKLNRKSGREVDRYFRENYPHQNLDDPSFRNMVARGITENEFSRRKLPEGERPDVQCYRTGSVLVGIDLSSGEFHVGGERASEFAPIHDDLVLYRGLDEEDLDNFFLAAEYVTLSQKKKEQEEPR